MSQDCHSEIVHLIMPVRFLNKVLASFKSILVPFFNENKPLLEAGGHLCSISKDEKILQHSMSHLFLRFVEIFDEKIIFPVFQRVTLQF